MSPFEPPIRNACYTVFSDESGVGERVLGYGGTLMPGHVVSKIEAHLEAFASSVGFGAKEFNWKKCSKNELDRYKLFVDAFWDLQAPRSRLDFRAMLVDTAKNPLTAPAAGCHNDEEGFYKLYHFFITRSLENVGARSTCVDLRVAVVPDRYPYRAEILGKTVGGRLKDELGTHALVTEVNRGTPKMARVHQLADVRLGAVTYRVSKRDPQGLSQKRFLCEHIEARVGKRLDHDFLPSQRPFNIWFFASGGSNCWGKGAQGVVGR